MTESSYLEQLKLRLKILHDDDDENLKNLIEIAHAKIQSWCGQFTLDNLVGRDLVFDYVRFAYNGKSEYFYNCFSGELSSFGFSLMKVGDDSEGKATTNRTSV